MLAWMAYLFIAAAWGSSFAAIAVAMRAFTPLGLVGVRFALGGALALLAGRLRGERFDLRDEWITLLGTGLLMVLGNEALMFWAETRLSSGLTAVLVATQPILLTLMARERLTALGWGGLGLGLLGVALLAGFSPGGAFSFSGTAAVLLGAAFWSAGSLLGKAGFRGRPGFTRTGWQMLAGGLPALLLAAPGGHILAAPLSHDALWAALYLAVVGSMLAFSAYLYLLDRWPASRVGTYAYLNALVAVFAGAWFLKEPFTPRMGLGALVVIGGVALLRYAPHRTARPMLACEGEA